MELFNLLETPLSVFGQTFDVSLNWIGQLIRWLCNGVGVVGVGIILFSLILKAITLPFDIFQRITMRKQNAQMKANQERMEKLQKQYANDKEKYNQKVMEMYKENGMGVFSSCLPMILSLVIFIVAINAFNAYAQYSNVENYNTLVNAYNGEMKSYSVQLTEDNYDDVVTSSVDGDYVVYTVKDDAEGKFVYYKVSLAKDVTPSASVINANPNKDYYVDEARAIAENAEIAKYVQNNADKKQGDAVKDYLVGNAQTAVVTAYETQVKSKTSFLWIKNIWATDAVVSLSSSCAFKDITPVLQAEDFASEAAREEFEVNDEDVSYSSISAYTNAYTIEAYNHVTAKLETQKTQANGYYILIVLSIGTILLQQLITMRSQKEQQKFSTVDGMGGSQQKMMLVVMTVMFAFFSFMYSSAFSIYMITSNIFSLCSTLIINKCVDRKMEKTQSEATAKKFTNNTMARIEQAKNAGKQSAEESKKKNK